MPLSPESFLCIKDSDSQNWLVYSYNGAIYLEKTDYQVAIPPILVDAITQDLYTINVDTQEENLYLSTFSGSSQVLPIIRDTLSGEFVKFGVADGSMYLETGLTFPGRVTFKFEVILRDSILLESKISTSQTLTCLSETTTNLVGKLPTTSIDLNSQIDLEKQLDCLIVKEITEV